MTTQNLLWIYHTEFIRNQSTVLALILQYRQKSRNLIGDLGNYFLKSPKKF